MSLYCPNCGFDNRSTARFCRQCSAPLSGSAPSPPQPLPVQPPVLPAPPGPVVFPPQSGATACLVAPDGRRYSLSSYTMIGRGPTCNVILSDSSVSAQHAIITESGGQWQLTDNNSRNGTFVNRMRIVSPCTLHDGDQVMFGSAVLRFEVSSSAVGGTTVLDPDQVAQLTGGGAQGRVLSAKSGFFGPKARGKIMAPPSERQDQPPTDWTRVMISVAVTLVFLGALLTFLIYALALGIVLLCIGGAFLLPLILLLWAPVQMIYGGIMGALKDDKPVTIVNFRILDEFSGAPMDVTFVRKHGTGGGIAQGDVVEVWGRQRGGAAMTATKLRVIEQQGQSTSIYIPIRNPWPWWIGIIAWILAVAILVYGYAALRGSF